MHCSPVVTIVGAGSLFFGRQAIWSMHHLTGLKGGTLRLVDTDPHNLGRMEKLARMAVEGGSEALTVEACDNVREALPGSDFVVLSFSERNAYYRGIDCRIAARYHIRMCSGDTIGPGGVFRTLREFGPIMDVAKAVEELCPDAWLINYVNPSAIFGIALMRHFNGNCFALCDSHHMPRKKEQYLKLAGGDASQPDRFDFRIAGVNHFTFLLSATLDGEDVLPRIHDAFRGFATDERDEGHSKARFNNFITAQMGDVFGAIPTCTGHTKEYVPYYQARAAVPEPIAPLAVFDASGREKETADMWSQIDDYLAGRKTMGEFHEKTCSDHATDIINTMVTRDGRTYFINVPNARATDGSRPVENLPADAFLELHCRLDQNGPVPFPVGEMPLGLRALQMQILDCHELTVEACVKKDRALLVRALAMDPLVNSIATAEAVIQDLYEAEKEALEPWVGQQAAKNATSPAPGQAPQLF